MKIKNLLFQPITLHLALDGEGLHLNAREVREVLAERVSGEIKLAAERGLVSLIGKVGVQAVQLPRIQAGVDAVSAVMSSIDDVQTIQKKGNRR